MQVSPATVPCEAREGEGLMPLPASGPCWPSSAFAGAQKHRRGPSFHLHLVVLLGAHLCPDFPLLKSSTLLQCNCLNGPPLQGSCLQRVAF